jgi:hypothetical protein
MIGASKINPTTDDLDRLHEMFDMGLNNSEIARIYRTNSGESLSRIHISSIRRNKRWNTENHSFVMKYELGGTYYVNTDIMGTKYKTVIGVVLSDTSNLYIYLRYKDGSLKNEGRGPMMTERPSVEDLMRFHDKWIFDDVAKLG